MEDKDFKESKKEGKKFKEKLSLSKNLEEIVVLFLKIG